MKTATHEVDENEMDFNHFQQVKYRTALELGYSNDVLVMILKAETKNDIYRILNDARKDLIKKEEKPMITIDDVKKNPVIKNYETCFYYKNAPKEDKNLKMEKCDCACLDCMMCQDNPNKQCSFYIPKNEYVWGKTRNDSPMPVKKKNKKKLQDDPFLSNGRRYNKRIPAGLEV